MSVSICSAFCACEHAYESVRACMIQCMCVHHVHMCHVCMYMRVCLSACLSTPPHSVQRLGRLQPCAHCRHCRQQGRFGVFQGSPLRTWRFLCPPHPAEAALRIRAELFGVSELEDLPADVVRAQHLLCADCWGSGAQAAILTLVSPALRKLCWGIPASPRPADLWPF